MGKLRFRVEANGVERHLLAVEKTRDGSLVFIPPIDETNFGTPQVYKLRDYHFTAHTARPEHQYRGDWPAGHHIHESLLTEGDFERLSRSTIVQVEPHQLFRWLVVSVAAGSLDSKKFNSTPEDGDRVIDLLAYDQSEILLYHVFVGDAAIEWKSMQGFSKWSCSYGAFSICIYLTFAHLPASPTTYFLTSQKTTPRASADKSVPPTVVWTMPASEIERLLQLNTMTLLHPFSPVARAAKAEGRPFLFSEVARPQDLSRWPRLQTFEQTLWGQLSRFKNDIDISPVDVSGAEKSASDVAKLIESERAKNLVVMRKLSYAQMQTLLGLSELTPYWRNLFVAELKRREGVRVFFDLR